MCKEELLYFYTFKAVTKIIYLNMLFLIAVSFSDKLYQHS